MYPELCSEKYLDEELNFLIHMIVENVNDRDYLNYLVKENKYPAPKTENTESNIVKLP